jgi:hypothetical protein
LSAFLFGAQRKAETKGIIPVMATPAARSKRLFSLHFLLIRNIAVGTAYEKMIKGVLHRCEIARNLVILYHYVDTSLSCRTSTSVCMMRKETALGEV